MIEFDVNRLYDIVTKLKYNNDERRDTKAICAKNPSDVMYKRYERAKDGYLEALRDFDEFVEEYLRMDDEN